MEKQTVENKVKEIAEAMGLTYLCESWFRANQAFDRFRRQGESREVTHPDGLTLPACLYVQPVAGFLNFTSQGFVRDAPSCLISFADAMPLDAGDRRAAERSCRAIHRRRKRKRLFRSGRRANQLPRRVRQDGRKPMYRNAVADTPRTGGRLLRLRLVAMDVQRIELEADRIVAEELDRARQKIIENHVAAGQRTTGTTADSITIAVTTNGGVTTGTMDARPYFAALETGTQPWQSQHFRRRRDGSVYPSAPKWFIDIIADWAATKGVDISAWGAATKIMTEGSALFRNGGREDIFTPEIAALSDRIADRLAGLFDAQIVESILRQ